MLKVRSVAEQRWIIAGSCQGIGGVSFYLRLLLLSSIPSQVLPGFYFAWHSDCPGAGWGEEEGGGGRFIFGDKWCCSVVAVAQ